MNDDPLEAGHRVSDAEFWNIPLMSIHMSIHEKVRMIRQHRRSYAAAAFHRMVGRVPVRAFWWNEAPNFGDLITPALLRASGLVPVWQSAAEDVLLATGSILQHAANPDSFSGTVFGSGLIKPISLRLPKARILAVRGELTRAALGVASDLPLGDPGLLMPYFMPFFHENGHVPLGLVPHYVDFEDHRIPFLQDRLGNDLRIIDVRRPVDEVCRDIASCRGILSSSLHGVIIAHAYGVPACWLELSDKVYGGGFKFHDYHSAFDVPCVARTLSGSETAGELEAMLSPVPSRIGEVSMRLLQVWKGWVAECRGTGGGKRRS